MTKEEMLKQEAEEWLNKWELCNKCDHKVQCIEDNVMCLQVVERAYLASAEPRERQITGLSKHILELQKDKGELIDKVRELEEENEYFKDLVDTNSAEWEEQGKRVCDLEKENAELKHSIATLWQEKDNVSMHTKAMEVVAKTRSDQLTKSKELLKQWLQTSKASGCDNINIITDTEQFLKDSEPQSKWINPVRTTNDNEIKIK